MRLAAVWLVALALVSSGCGSLTSGGTGGLSVYMYSAIESDVNAFVVHDGTGALLIDCTRNSAEAGRLATMARSKGPAPFMLFITHGHPDHYLGMARIRREFPDVRIAVASQAIKDDIAAFSDDMDAAGALEQERAMKPRSARNPAGFDYAREIEVLPAPEIRMPGGTVLEVKSDYPAGEAPHASTLHSKEAGALFASDLVYNRVHLWLGPGVGAPEIANWKSSLAALESSHARPGTKVFPGHGPPADGSIFADNRKYIDDLLRSVREATSEEDAATRMKRLYPLHRDSDFLLARSVRHQLELLRK